MFSYIICCDPLFFTHTILSGRQKTILPTGGLGNPPALSVMIPQTTMEPKKGSRFFKENISELGTSSGFLVFEGLDNLNGFVKQPFFPQRWVMQWIKWCVAVSEKIWALNLGKRRPFLPAKAFRPRNGWNMPDGKRKRWLRSYARNTRKPVIKAHISDFVLSSNPRHCLGENI